MSVEELARELGIEEILGIWSEADEDLNRDQAPEIDGTPATHMLRGELVA